MDTQFRLFPEQASTVAPRVDALFFYIAAVACFFTVVIAIALMTFAVRYRRRREDYYPKPIVGSKALEITWSVIPLCLSLVMFWWGASLYIDMRTPPQDALEVYVIGKQWMWQLQHAEGQREINELHVPVGRPVKLIMTSEDVLHDFYIPAFRTKQDVVPGRYNFTWFEATKTGTYDLYCALYCGTDHSRMIGKVVVMEKLEYERWLSLKADRSLALQGRQLFQKLQCVTCHYTAAGNRAPNLEGIYRSTVELEGGKRVRADESYLRESILFPNAKVRQGYRSIMPTYQGQVSEDDLVRLVAFLKGLGPGQTPPRVEQAEPPVTDRDKKK
jgi:cytochrome c oxidase subunit 2